MHQPLVSVIVPTFNQRIGAVRAVQSALAQTYPRCEIIVQDDGSTDGTAEAVGSLSPAISCQIQEHRGLGTARNNAIRRSRGELVALLDPDDVWTTDKLERCVGYLQARPDVDIVYSPTMPPTGEGECLAGWLLDELFDRNFIRDSAAVFHRRVWERVGGFDESLPLHVGHNFWVRAAVGQRFGLVPEPLVHAGHQPVLSRNELAHRIRIQVEMLYRFFEAQGGKERLDRFRAARTFARLGYAAGMRFLLEGDGTQAVRMLYGALICRPTPWIRVLYYAARLQRWWLNQPVYQEPPLVYVTC